MGLLHQISATNQAQIRSKNQISWKFFHNKNRGREYNPDEHSHFIKLTRTSKWKLSKPINPKQFFSQTELPSSFGFWFPISGLCCRCAFSQPGELSLPLNQLSSSAQRRIQWSDESAPGLCLLTNGLKLKKPQNFKSTPLCLASRKKDKNKANQKFKSQIFQVFNQA